MLGLTMIYVPLESRELTAEEGSADKELVKRLEGVVAYWNTQIKIALSDHEQASPHELLCLDDEYDFWTYRCKCLLLEKDVVAERRERIESFPDNIYPEIS